MVTLRLRFARRGAAAPVDRAAAAARALRAAGAGDGGRAAHRAGRRSARAGNRRGQAPHEHVRRGGAAPGRARGSADHRPRRQRRRQRVLSRAGIRPGPREGHARGACHQRIHPVHLACMTKAPVLSSFRETFLHFARPDIGEDEIREVTDALRSGWVTTGPKTRQLEKEFAAAVGAKHAIAVNSCTAAMHLALEAAGVRAGDEVITTPYTFAASAEVIRYFDARPVLVDIDAATFNIRPDLIEAAITAKTRAIIPVHMAGVAAD